MFVICFGGAFTTKLYDLDGEKRAGMDLSSVLSNLDPGDDRLADMLNRLRRM